MRVFQLFGGQAVKGVEHYVADRADKRQAALENMQIDVLAAHAFKLVEVELFGNVLKDSELNVGRTCFVCFNNLLFVVDV